MLSALKQERVQQLSFGSLPNGRALRPSVVCCLWRRLCIVAERYVIEQKLLLTAYRKSYMSNQLVPKWMTLTCV